VNAAAVGDTLEEIAILLELKGENPFKIRAYTRAARALETLSEDLGTLVAEKRLEEVDGIGKAIAEKVTLLVTTGKLEYLDGLRGEFPAGIFELFELQGLGAKKIKLLYDKLGVDSVAKLKAVCEDGSAGQLPGLGEKSATNFLKAIVQREKCAGQFRLGDISALADGMLDDLRTLPEVDQVQVAGSHRRRKEVVGDLDFIVATRHPKEVSEYFVSHPLVDSILAQGATKSSVLLKNGIQCDLRVVKADEFPFALNYFTGSKEHNVKMRSLALERGWSLNEYRFSVAEGRPLREPLPEVQTEEDIYGSLGLAYVEPELREDRGEFAAAAEGTLPKLIELANLRGTFHCHTTASDGRATLDEMAEAALELGLQYLGIADHSKSSVQAHGLDEKRLLEQVKTIEEYNARDTGLRLFSGTECDIKKDGSLDFPEEVLSRLDYVVASVHSAFTLSETAMTERLIKAMSSPHVTMLGHLTGRLLLSREPYQVNIPAVIEAAAETGTLIEINASPYRLDMDWRWWPQAKEKGVRCVINPDAHSTRGFQDLVFGIGVARKGWLTREDVVNTLPLGKIEAVLAAKRH
jgi:DNA polymerase (family X)